MRIFQLRRRDPSKDHCATSKVQEDEDTTLSKPSRADRATIASQLAARGLVASVHGQHNLLVVEVRPHRRPLSKRRLCNRCTRFPSGARYRYGTNGSSLLLKLETTGVSSSRSL